MFTCGSEPGEQDVCIPMCAGEPGEQHAFILHEPARQGTGCMYFHVCWLPWDEDVSFLCALLHLAGCMFFYVCRRAREAGCIIDMRVPVSQGGCGHF